MLATVFYFGFLQTTKFFLKVPILVSIVAQFFSTLMILLFSLLLWLEITVFQIWTVITFIIFVLVALIQVLLRKVELSDTELSFRAVIPFNNFKIKKVDIKEIEVRKYGLFIKTKYRDYRLIVSKRVAENAYNNMTK